MRIFALLALATGAAAQTSSFTLDQVLSAPFPSALTSSPSGGKIAWVSNARGVRNIIVAEPPEYRPRRITSYTTDDGQELSDVRWTPDASALVYVRGSEAGPFGESPNPTHDVQGAEQAVWIVRLDGAPRRIGEGDSPAISPKGDRVAFVRRGQLWLAPIDGATPAAQAFKTHGQSSRPVWSPDGSRIAFASSRGDHAFIGVYSVAANALHFLDASTDRDAYPVWAPDGRNVAFLRTPSNGLRPIREAKRTGEPWAIRVADAETGAGREIWRAAEGSGSVFHEVVADNQLFWADGNRIVFPWERDGWTRLYSLPAAGGNPALLTPGEFEVEDAALAANRRDVIYSSNQGDINRRHLWSVPAAGGAPPTALTTGTGIECRPVPASEGAVLAMLRADAQKPMRPAIRSGNTIRDLEDLPADFPASRLVTPQPVFFPSADGLSIHGQLFLPPRLTGRAPAIVFVHGGPRRQMMLGWHAMYYYSNAYGMNQYLASLGYIVLSVNFRSGIGYGLNFREALNFGASGGAEFADVQGAGIYLRSRTDVDPTRIGIWGGSYGGYLTALALARASDLFRAGVDYHGVHDWARELGIPAGAPDYKIAFEASPMAFVDTWRSPVLLIHGDDDPDVQFNQTVMLKDALRARKIPLEEMILPDEVHDFLLWRSWRDTYRAAADFFARRLR